MLCSGCAPLVPPRTKERIPVVLLSYSPTMVLSSPFCNSRCPGNSSMHFRWCWNTLNIFLRAHLWMRHPGRAGQPATCLHSRYCLILPVGHMGTNRIRSKKRKSQGNQRKKTSCGHNMQNHSL